MAAVKGIRTRNVKRAQSHPHAGRRSLDQIADARDRRPHPGAERRGPQAHIAARRQPGALEPGQPQVGVPSRARDPRALPRHQPQRHCPAARRRQAFTPARVDRRARATLGCAARRHARPAGLRQRTADRDPPGQPRAGARRPVGEGPSWRAPDDPRRRPTRRRRRPDLHLRAGAAVAQVPRRPRSGARVQERSQLRPHHEVLRCRGVDARRCAQDAAAGGNGSAAPGRRERAPA